MAGRLALIAALVAGVLPFSGAGGAPAQTPKRGGTVVYSRPAEPACLNPFACDVLGDPVLTQVLEGAYEVGPDLVERPNLVSGVTIGRHPFSLTYHVRPEARWSDGVPVTASDFRFTQQKFATGGAPDVRELYQRIRRARVLDPKTYRVELGTPFADWRDLYEIVLPRHALAGEDLTEVWHDRIDNPKTGRPIGSGPFLVQRWERGKQLVLDRNPRYWGLHMAYLDRSSSDSTPIRWIRSGRFGGTISTSPSRSVPPSSAPTSPGRCGRSPDGESPLGLLPEWSTSCFG